MVVSRTAKATCVLALAMAVCTQAHSGTQQVSGTNDIISGVRAEQPENMTFAGSWPETQSQLLAYLNRPSSEDEQVIAEIRDMGANASPALMMVMAIRVAETRPDEAALLFQQGAVLARLSLAACRDTSAAGGLQFVMRSVTRAMQRRNSPLLAPERQLRGYVAILEAGNMPSLTASPWWVCSHGLQTLHWGRQSPDRVMPLGDWYAGEAAVHRNRERLLTELTDFVAAEHERTAAASDSPAL